MKSRPAPTVGDRRPADALAEDPQLIAWTKRMAADPDVSPADLSEAELRFLTDQILGRRGMGISETHYEKALRETCPVLSMPQVTNIVDDLRKAFSLPEMTEWWASWSTRRGARGPEAGTAGRKMLMSALAMTGMTPHANTAHEILVNNPALRAVFDELEARARSLDAIEPIEPMCYAAANHREKKLHLACDALHPTNRAILQLVKSLQEIHGDRIGKGWLIDGCATPAWAPQRGARGNDGLELELRRHSPEAGHRAIGYSRRGKRDIGAMSDAEVRGQVTGGTSKHWRGYYSVLLIEQATGIGIPTLVDAATDEARAMVPALSTLFRHWPELDGHMEWLAGDSAWDEGWACKTAEVHYGVHLIARLHDERPPREIALARIHR